MKMVTISKNSQNQIQNQIQNNIQNIFFVNLSKEDLVNKLSDKEQNKVLNKRYQSLEYFNRIYPYESK